MKKKINILITILITLFLISGCGPKYSTTDKGNYILVQNEDGQTLGYSTSSGVALLEDGGYAFKDLNKNGELDPYEDWRLSYDERAKDLSSKMSIEQIAGLMLYSAHQAVSESEPTDDQKDFLVNDNLRHVLVTSVASPEIAAQWSNNVQALVEGIGLGIPANNSSDPRNGTTADAEFNAGAGGAISMWPTSLGMAATFDPSLVENFGDIASKEYRALGITTALSPQIDLATEPRWSRFSGTFGENSDLDADMARAYADGFQTSYGEMEISEGWGYNSVNAMVKHWPSGGPEEGGRDGHYSYGKYAVYPGNNFEEHLKPFTEGAFNLNGKTGSASAVMPYYTISYNQDQVTGENVGNSYSEYIINDLLRGKYGYDGVVCTDWMVTADNTGVDSFSGKCWGTELLTVAERHYKILMAGVDQFGGNNDSDPVIEAYNMMVESEGEEWARNRFEQSAVRLLRNIFRVGLFENPYLDVENTVEVVGNPDFMAAGYEAQLKSIVMLKNAKNTLPLKEQATVYIPQKYFPAQGGMFGFGQTTEAKWDYPFNIEIIKKYVNVTDNPEEADYALVYIDSPSSGNGYSTDDVNKGGNGYVPISLQYGDYTATYARGVSIAGGDPKEDFTNRSYKGKTVTTSNAADLDLVLNTKKEMGEKPVIVVVNVSKPMIFAEFEDKADAILVSFGVQDQAIMDVLSGKAEPSGLLPFQMPANMKTVEEQYEDVPHDMECYVDSEGNTYDFGYGMNWSGVIQDARTEEYAYK
uniref:beta-glucosidase n=1 Tax=uncultured microorganism TaxID=358574 RepID=W5XAT9_9ZZZZ|nr:beta-glucosidase [uncultured microorganism]